ncbi:unnamed protein product [Spirodela intermedia]|uniref:Uncharacterized protein n=1 Tax=Spirodela intermedia TaxID=51605 RepID=A0A7I8KJH3_SPIIN|nr:unnamed protein product [Spirodela intermedia]
MNFMELSKLSPWLESILKRVLPKIFLNPLIIPTLKVKSFEIFFIPFN